MSNSSFTWSLGQLTTFPVLEFYLGMMMTVSSGPSPPSGFLQAGAGPTFGAGLST